MLGVEVTTLNHEQFFNVFPELFYPSVTVLLPYTVFCNSVAVALTITKGLHSDG